MREDARHLQDSNPAPFDIWKGQAVYLSGFSFIKNFKFRIYDTNYNFTMIMEKLRVSSKRQSMIKMALQGCAGSGKTYSALLLAYGLTKDWSRIAVIDSENGSADLYAGLGGYNVLPITDYSPETYIEAINICESAGMEVIIIDSISHCWDYLLEYHAGLMGNSFVNWAKVTPRQNAFIQRILQSKSHIICTMRTKQDYVLNERNGKMVPEKVGLKAVMRDGVDYEFTIVLDIDLKHHAVASKDRTGLFMGKPEFTITPETGESILKWCNSESRPDVVNGVGFQMSQPSDSRPTDNQPINNQPRQYNNNYQNTRNYGNNVYAQGRN